MSPTLNNIYWLLRHGRSRANESQTIVSSLENGVKEEWCLSDIGIGQAEAAGRKLFQQLQQIDMKDVQIYVSPFSRTKQTAALVAKEISFPVENIKYAVQLRERFFGTSYELQPYVDAYNYIWSFDEKDSNFKPGVDGESVSDVSKRILSLIEVIEKDHKGMNILLVSHGDVLSITQATFQLFNIGEHHKLGFETAELRRMN